MFELRCAFLLAPCVLVACGSDNSDGTASPNDSDGGTTTTSSSSASGGSATAGGASGSDTVNSSTTSSAAGGASGGTGGAGGATGNTSAAGTGGLTGVDGAPIAGGPGFSECTHVGSGTDYPVGPGQTYESIGDAPLETLQGGDTLRIHWREEPYHEKLMIGGQGTDDQPVRVCGVPGPNGELPVIDGTNATTREALVFPYEGHQVRGVIVIGHRNGDPYEEIPGPFLIERLAVTGGTSDASFTDVAGQTQPYSSSVAGIFVQRADGVTIRGCEIYGNANGMFIGTAGGQEATSNVLLEANYVHGNGTPGSDRQHNIYNEAIGVVYQFNRFGPLNPESLGANIKERSAGVVLRYNWIEDGAHLIDLVDAQEARSTTVAMEEFHQTFLYGNVIVRNGRSTSMIHYGGDSGLFEDYRKGTLYSYHNTVIIKNEGAPEYEAQAIFELSTNDESLSSRNDVFYVTTPTTPTTPVVLLGWRDSEAYGIAELEGSWISPHMTPWRQIPDVPENFYGMVTGFEPRPAGADPMLVNITDGDYRPTANSPLLATGIDLSGDLPEGYLPAYVYVPHLDGEERSEQGAATLGALLP